MRIISLLPAATEIICALGLDTCLVAVSHECNYPEKVTGLPRITSAILSDSLSPENIDREVVKAVQEGEALYKIDGEMLQKLEPDLIITQGVCDVCAVNTNTVDENMVFLTEIVSNRVQVVSLNGGTYAGILHDIRRVAGVTDTENEAVDLIREMNRRWQKLLNSGLYYQPNVMMLEWPDPFFYGGHWVPEMVKVAGGKDVMGKPGEPSGRCTAVDIQNADPEIIISIACGFDAGSNLEFAQQLLQHPELEQIPAIKNKKVWGLNADAYFSRPGPRIVTGAEQLQDIFTGKMKQNPEILRV